MNQVAVFNEISIDIESDCSSIQFLVARTSLALSLSLVDQFNHTMGKGKKHNKLYITQSEWINEFGGKRLDGNEFEGKGHKALPFHCCALSLTPFETPVCTPDGIIYEITCVSCRPECCISSRDHRWLTHRRALSLSRVQEHHSISSQAQGRSDIGAGHVVQELAAAALPQERRRSIPRSDDAQALQRAHSHRCHSNIGAGVRHGHRARSVSYLCVCRCHSSSFELTIDAAQNSTSNPTNGRT